MKLHLYKITCISGLHVGAGDVNYSVIDNEVEKDSTTGYPVVHSSGIKGAFLREMKKLLGQNNLNQKDIDYIFGKEGTNDSLSTGGNYDFMDARFFSRPMRLDKNPRYASVSVSSIAAVEGFVNTALSLGCNLEDCIEAKMPSEEIFKDKNKDDSEVNSEFLIVGCNGSCSIECEPTRRISEKSECLDEHFKSLVRLFVGDGLPYALAKNINEYSLPIVARNVLDDRGNSKNLWYEEFVPGGSNFYLPILIPDGEQKCRLDILTEQPYLQIGGHASNGYGLVKLDKLYPVKETSAEDSDDGGDSDE